jgi:hypothetical protein
MFQRHDKVTIGGILELSAWWTCRLILMGSPDPIPPKPSQWGAFLSKLGGRVGDLAVEFIGTFLAIGGIALADLLVKCWLGDEKTFFDIIPVQWVFYFGHVALVGRLIYRIFVPEKE